MTRSLDADRRRRVVLACMATALALLLAEGAVRLASIWSRDLRMVLRASTETTEFSDADTLKELMSRTMLGFSPGTTQYGFVLNSRSFRTKEYDPAPAPDRFRVVALGDSFTFASGGLPHRDHWTTLLEERLAADRSRTVEVLRLGVPGTGPAFQLRLWQIEAAVLAPDVVIVGFFVGNDFTDHRGNCGALCGGPPSAGSRLASASALYRAVRNLLRIRRATAAAVRDRPRPADDSSKPPGAPIPGYAAAFDPDRPSLNHADFIAVETQRMALCLISEHAAFEELLNRAAAEVIELAAEVERSGARCVVMVIPDQYQVDPALVAEVLANSGRSVDDYDLDRPQRRLTEVLGAAGVEVLDLLPVFRAHASDGPLYRPSDTHWNRRGNELAAHALAKRLTGGGQPAAALIFASGLESGALGEWDRVLNSG